MYITAVVPIRKGSERVPNKNFKNFFEDKNLLQLKIEVLKKVNGIDDIVVNTDSDLAIDIAKSMNVSFYKRDDYFASSNCTNTEHWYNLAETTNSDVIIHTPCTAPLVTLNTFNDVINIFRTHKMYENHSNSYDSVNTVSDVKEYLWLDGKPINFEFGKVPNSQNLPNISKLTFGVSILSRETMLKNKSVFGMNPYFYKLNDIEAIDIDNPIDFEFAKFVYSKKENA